MNSIQHDLDLGKKIEEVWISYMDSAYKYKGRDVSFERAPNRRFPDWDIRTSLGHTYEVKFDSISHRTRNYFFEFRNPRRDVDSGLKISRADYLVYIHGKGIKLKADVFDLARLKYHLFSTNHRYESRQVRGETQRDKETGLWVDSWGASLNPGDKNSEGYVPNVLKIREIKNETGFMTSIPIPDTIVQQFL